MIKKWSLRPDPSVHDAARYTLLVQGEMKHVLQIVKKFGAMCGRPLKADDPGGFNFCIHLHRITPLGLEKVSRYLTEIAPGAGSPLPGPQPAAAPAPTPAPQEAPRIQEVPRVPVAEFFAAPATPAGPVAPPPVTEVPLSGPVLTPPPASTQLFPEITAPSLPPMVPPPTTPPPAAVPPAITLSSPPPITLSAPPPIALPPIAPPPPTLPPLAPPPAVAPAPAPAPAQAPTPAPVPAPAAAPVPTPTAVSAAAAFGPAAGAVTAAPVAAPALWGLRSNFDPKLNFDTLLVGAYNRFAHAAATSVVGSPGSMYNPLFIYGVPGVGKTHILHSIGAALAKTWDDNSVVLSTGANLASAVSAALAQGRLAEIEAVMGGAKALLIDDIHLLAISEKNQPVLAKLFQGFFARNLQVVLTSVYPPRTLGGLEEALKISLSRGWAVDMKLPSTPVQAEMIMAYVERLGIQIAAAEVSKLHERLGPNYSDFPNLLARWVALCDLVRTKGQNLASDDIVADLMNPGARSSQTEIPTAADLEGLKGFAPPPAGPGALNLAIFFPKGQNALVPWLGARFYQTAAKYGITHTFHHVICEAYETEEPLGVPFQIGESCRRAGAQAALVLGPPREAKLAAREGEFVHAVRHILANFGVSPGWIPMVDISATRPYLAAHLEILASRKA